MITTYQQAREYLETFIQSKFYKKITPGSGDEQDPLGRIRYFLELLNNPQEKFPSIVVSGTSGKGSTAYLTAHMLTRSGYKTGFASSPHLEKINERIQIGSGHLEHISDTEFISLLNVCVPMIERMYISPFGTPSYYEILLAMTFVYFAQQEVDIAVVEVGMEGRYDGTNVLQPLIFVLTNISLDHTAFLGDTVESIADEATARLLPEVSPSSIDMKKVVTGVTQPSVIQLVEKKAREGKWELSRLHSEFDVVIKDSSENGVVFDYSFGENILRDIQLSLIGEYQAENASIAITVVQQLEKFGFDISEDAIRNALSNSFFAGRFEIVHSTPMIILDGAHNVAKMGAFLKSLQTIFPQKRKIGIIAFKKDKDIHQLLDQIFSIFDTVIITEFHSTVDMGKNLSMKVTDLYYTIPMGKEVVFEKNIQVALQTAVDMAKKDDALIVTTGSLYLVGEMRKLVKER